MAFPRHAETYVCTLPSLVLASPLADVRGWAMWAWEHDPLEAGCPIAAQRSIRHACEAPPSCRPARSTCQEQPLLPARPPA